MNTTRWVTLQKAADIKGLPVTFYDERTGRSATWPEGTVWKWFEGRKMIDLEALDHYIDQKPGIPSTRGRKARELCPA